MYQPKHEKKVEYEFYSLEEIYDFMDELLLEFECDDLFLLPVNFLKDLNSYIKFSNNSVNGKVKFKKYDK